MNPEIVKQILDGYAALITEELGKTDAGKYTRIAKLCASAQNLRKLAIKRVSEVKEMKQAQEGAGIVGLVANGMIGEAVDDDDDGENRYRPIGGGGFGDMADTFREVMLQLSKQNERKIEPTPITFAQDPELRLSNLLDTRERLARNEFSVTEIDETIRGLLAQLGQGDRDANGSNVVHS